jgi:hypothetical protein
MEIAIVTFIVWVGLQIQDGTAWVAQQKVNRTCGDNHKELYVIPKANIKKFGETTETCKELGGLK